MVLLLCGKQVQDCRPKRVRLIWLAIQFAKQCCCFSFSVLQVIEKFASNVHAGFLAYAKKILGKWQIGFNCFFIFRSLESKRK